MVLTNPALKLTYEDYEHFPDDGKRHELIDGNHFVTPAPTRKHQYLVGRLNAWLFTFVDERRLGHVYSAPFDVVLSDADVVQPDLLFVSNERTKLLTEKNLQGAPDLVVEISSESTRRTDETAKRKLYERFGVREYWVVDPVLETVKVYRRTGGGFARASELSAKAADRLETPLLPGLELPLAELFVER
jgi:Uma2 family endonuclease